MPELQCSKPVRLKGSAKGRMKVKLLLAGMTIISITGCQSAYYKAWEVVGKEKRHLLRSNLEAAQDDQAEVKEDFVEILDEIKTLYSFSGGDIEKNYRRLKSQHESAADEQEDLLSRLKNVDRIAHDLFAEWKREANAFESKKYRTDSLTKLRASKKQFQSVRKVVGRSSQKLDRVLKKLNDQVIYLKHNLNAKAVGSLKVELKSIQGDIKGLIEQINQSIQVTNQYKQTLT